jgi:hypothetical protein
MKKLSLFFLFWCILIVNNQVYAGKYDGHYSLKSNTCFKNQDSPSVSDTSDMFVFKDRDFDKYADFLKYYFIPYIVLEDDKVEKPHKNWQYNLQVQPKKNVMQVNIKGQYGEWIGSVARDKMVLKFKGKDRKHQKEYGDCELVLKNQFYQESKEQVNVGEVESSIKFKDKLPDCKIENNKVITQTPCYGSIGYIYKKDSARKYTGNFNNGLRNGMGTLMYWTSNTKRYAGEWKNDKMHGQGTYTYADGRQVEGEWENDILILAKESDTAQKIVESSEVNDLELQKLQNQVESLIVSLEEEKRKFIDQKTKNDHLEKENLKLSADNKKLYTEGESQISSQEYDRIAKDNKTLKSETKSLKQKIKDAETQILKTNSETKSLKQKIKDAETQILKTNSDLDKLKLENKNLREGIEVAESSVDKLESEISKVQKELSEEELKEQKIATLVAKLSQKQLKDQSQDTSNSIAMKFSLLEARKEVGDGFTNYVASNNFTLLPSNFCILNLLEKKFDLEKNIEIGMFIDGYKPFFYNIDATDAFSLQNNIEFDLPSFIDANTDQCFPLVFEVPIVFKERDIIMFISNNDEIIESAAVQW